MFKKDDIIDYGFYKELKIVGKDDNCYKLEDKNGNTKKIYIDLIEKHGEKRE